MSHRLRHRERPRRQPTGRRRISNDPNVRFVEVDVDTTAYEQSHIPGAVGWNWTSQLADGIRRDIASREDFSKLLSESGIGPDTTIVLYGDNNNWFAAWAYWQLKLYGHKDVRILNGGRKYWLDNGLPLSTDVPSYDATGYQLPEADFSAARLPRRHPAASRRRRARARRRPFAGRVQRRDHRAPGHERDRPACRPHPGRRVDPVGPDRQGGRHVQETPRTSRTLYEAKGVTPDKDVIAYCRIGERSVHSWFVLHELLGYERVRNYDGSWTEYGSLIGVPIEKPVAVAAE